MYSLAREEYALDERLKEDKNDDGDDDEDENFKSPGGYNDMTDAAQKNNRKLLSKSLFLYTLSISHVLVCR